MPESVMAADEVGLCDCADCGAILLGERTRDELAGVPRIRWPLPARAALRLGRWVQLNEHRLAPLCRGCARRRGLM